MLIVTAGFGQQQKIDSLRNVADKVRGISKYEPLIELVRVYASDNRNNEALSIVQEANAIAKSLGDSSKIVNSSRIIGQLLNRLDKPKEAEEILLQVLPVAKRNQMRSDYKIILNNIALAYTIQAKYDKALETHFQALKLREEDKDMVEISTSLNNIGLVYFKLKNYGKALEFYNRALSLNTEDYLLVNIGLCYNQMSNFEKAHEYFKRAFEHCGSDCSDRIKIDGQFGFGVSYFGMQDFTQAKSHFQQSYEIAKKIGNERFQVENQVYLAKIAIREEEYQNAENILRQIEPVAFKLGYNQLLIDIYKYFSLLYNQSKEFEKASIYQDKYIQLKDSLIGEELVANIAKIQANFEERENIKTIQAKEEQINRQRNLNIAIAIIAILAALLIFVLYRSNRIKKKVNAALSEAKAIIEDQNRQLLNSNIHLDKELKEKNLDLEKANESLRRVNDELDNFIYKTSHDIRGPLASLKGMCNVALMDVKDPIALNYLRKLDITAEKLNTILTRLLIVNQINNSTLGSERIDFNTIINDVLLLEKKKGLPPRLIIRKKVEQDIEFQSDKEFVRIILENLIDNAIKFYNDSQRIEPFVDIAIVSEDQYINIRVVDNGIGISQVHPDKIFQMFSRASERSETGGIGLYITKTAVQKLGGTINLKTTPEGFTEFSIRLPLSTAKVIA